MENWKITASASLRSPNNFFGLIPMFLYVGCDFGRPYARQNRFEFWFLKKGNLYLFFSINFLFLDPLIVIIDFLEFFSASRRHISIMSENFIVFIDSVLFCYQTKVTFVIVLFASHLYNILTFYLILLQLSQKKRRTKQVKNREISEKFFTNIFFLVIQLT